MSSMKTLNILLYFLIINIIHYSFIASFITTIVGFQLRTKTESNNEPKVYGARPEPGSD